MTQPAFLYFLEVDDSADERAIRRAYARKLKLIDQEKDAAGFQALREAYEVALQWVRWQQQQLAQQMATGIEESVAEESASGNEPLELAPVPGSDQASTNPQVPAASGDQELDAIQPEVEARGVFGELVAELAALSSAAGWSSDKVHRDKLLRCLDDPRLLSIAARDIFEWYVAELLASGWQPGHEALLVAAVQVFSWEEDPRRLVRFGWVGDTLNRAITERAVFDQQPEPARKAQRDLIARLRDPVPPSHGELIAKMHLVEWIFSRFPVWLPLISSVENLRLWRELDARVPAWKRRLSFQKKGKPGDSSSFAYVPASQGINWRWSVVIVIVVFLRIVFSVSPSNTPSPSVPTSSVANVFQQQGNGYGGRNVNAPGAFPYASSTVDTFRAESSKFPESAPVLPSKAELTALVNGRPNLEKCDEIARLTKIFRIGTPQALTRFAPAFQRQVINCANGGLWPRSVYQDPAVQEAVRQEEKRNAEIIKSVSREMADLVKANPPVTRPASLPVSEKTAVMPSGPGLNGVVVAAPSFKPIEQNWSLKTDSDKYQLAPKEVQFNARD